MVTIIEKLHQLLDLAHDIGGPQFREDIVALVVKPSLERTYQPRPIYRDYVHGPPPPMPLSLAWLYQDLHAFEAFWGHRPDAIKVTERQQRAITDLIHPRYWAPAKATHFDGIPLKVIAHSGGGITG